LDLITYFYTGVLLVLWLQIYGDLNVDWFPELW
jgi:hypothetical protein